MVFSSISFLYYFLPITLLLYFLIFKKSQNLVLLFASLFFYFYGEPKCILVLLFSCIFNYYYGKFLETSQKSLRKFLLIINLVINFGILFYFKYFQFFLDNINYLFKSNISWSNILMPIGISFFTFQATSYIIDIYNNKVKSANSFLTFATYLSLFPQLIAGPIVRYETIEEDIQDRKCSFKTFASGVKRFIIGLSKKVLLANVLGELSKNLISISTQTILSYWLQALSNMLQLYFDFSGYSDMAIGLGLMFGFHFLENFNYPFISRSITDFWRRWHISLSTWFRDYVYIPLGGSKVGVFKKYCNIFIVWMVTGLWHGASWNFVLWGLYFALFLVFEKAFLLKILDKHRLFGHIYTLIIVLISFIIFNITDVPSIIIFIKNMFGFTNLNIWSIETLYYLKNYFGVIIISIIASTPLLLNLKEKINDNMYLTKILATLEPVFYISLLIISTAYIVDESFNPFLYFRF